MPAEGGKGRSAPVEEFDAVVVGSGFGGSVTSLRLSEQGHSVCLLERGKPYPPGSFARRPDEFARNFWDPSAGLHGLFDIWSFRPFSVVVSSGLGGGSLIYANVMLRKPATWFTNDPGPFEAGGDWPIKRSDLDAHYDTVASILSPVEYPYAGTTPKTQFLRRAGSAMGIPAQPLDLAITFSREDESPGVQFDSGDGNLHGEPRYTCRLCGECDIGCNFGSKNTLDFTYLSQADRAGACIRTLCEVREVRPVAGSYLVGYVRHSPANEGVPTNTRRLPVHWIRAKVVVLSAGSPGTPWLLWRNKAALPGLSPVLGSRFNGNGDALGWITGGKDELDASHGPVITNMIPVPDELDGGQGPGFFLQDAGHPLFVDWLFQSIGVAGFGKGLGALGLSELRARLLQTPRGQIGGLVAGLVNDGRPSAGVLPLLAMGREIPETRLVIKRGRLEAMSDPASPGLRFAGAGSAGNEAYARRVKSVMSGAARVAGGSLLLLPGSHGGRSLVAHPLGGAPMGTSPANGVVDNYGEVFGYRNLFVADGSVMPGPVGANPSMTIAALAERFSIRMLERLGRKS